MLQPCECPLAAGVCKRHNNLFKPEIWKRLCATNPKYRAAWDRGEGPGQVAPKPAGRIQEATETAACAYRGAVIREGSCDLCGMKGQPFEVFACYLHGECSIGRRHSKVRSCLSCRDNTSLKLFDRQVAQARPTKRHAFHWDGSTPEFISTSQYMRDVQSLVSMLPPNTSRILGTARSGLCAATMVSMLMHRPLSVVREQQKDVIDSGHGWRLTGSIDDTGPVVVVDDTVMTGGSFNRIMPIVRQVYPEALTAAVYLNPNANLSTPDLFSRHLKWPHVLEWNFANSIVSPNLALDFDGILCADCPPGDDDDGERYAAFLKDAKPLYYVRKHPIPLIVTGRLEKYRAETLDWLSRHGMSVKTLVMWRGTTAERWATPHRMADYKAGHFKAFIAERRNIKPPMFVESDPGQAKRIAEISGGVVVCPAAGKCFKS